MAEEDASELRLGPDFETSTAYALSLAEVNILCESLAASSEVAVSPVFESVHRYATKFTQFRGEEAARQARRLASRPVYRLYNYEVATLLTLCPETAKEAIALVPSLQQPDQHGNLRISEDDLESLLEELRMYMTGV